MGRVRTNGGNYTSLSVVANDTFCKMADSAGNLLSLGWRVNTYTGLDLLACLTPLINTSGNTADTNNNFVSGDYSEATGLTGNGTTKYLQTGINPNTTFSQNDCGFGCYVRTNVAEVGAQMGCATGGGGCYMYIRYGAGNVDGTQAVNGSYAGAVNVAGDTSAQGLYHLSRTSSTSLVLYKNGVSFGSSATASQAVTNDQLIVHGYSFSLIAQQFSAKALGGYFAVKGMTAAQSLSWYNAWQRKETILARQV